MTLPRFARPCFAALAATLAVAACSDGAGTAAAAPGERSSFELPNDHAIGSPDAPVTIVEYASVSCGACASWSNTVYPELKDKYIDTGKVRFVLREFPAGNYQLFLSGSMIANCADDKSPGAFFDNVKLQFERQNEIFRYAQQAPEQLRDQYFYIAEQGGLSQEEAIACLSNEDVQADMETRIQSGYDLGVSGTPAFFINGEKTDARTLEEFDEAIEAAIAASAGTSGG